MTKRSIFKDKIFYEQLLWIAAFSYEVLFHFGNSK